MSYRSCKLGEVCLVQRGITITQKQAIDGAIPVVAGGLKPTYFHNKANRFNSTITISGSGANAGFVNMWKQPIFASDCSTVEVKDSDIDIVYVYYFLLSKQGYIYEKLRSGAAQPHVYGKDIAQLDIKIPPLPIQQKIVARLDAIFAEIDKASAATEANAKNAESLFQSYITEVFGNNKWQTIKIENLYKVASSKRVLKSEWQTNGVPFYRGREITLLSKYDNVANELYITEEMFNSYAKNYGVPKENDIMITAIGTIGNSYIVKKTDKFYFKDASVLWLKNIGNTKSEFINYWFKSSHFYNQLSVGLGATVDTLTIGKVQSLIVNLPNEEEQIETVKLLDNFNENLKVIQSSHKNKIVELKALKQSILQKAFSGELVKD